jgi:cob(I)alamin adenosyltransferase
MKNKRVGYGPIIVYTGGGKGKTTAALGLALRAVGYHHRVVMIQFIKGSWHYGERDSAKLLAPYFTLVPSGRGFVGILDDKLPRSVHIRAAEETLKKARQLMRSGKVNILICDEINYALQMKLLKLKDVLAFIDAKPDPLTLVLTGNGAHPQVIKRADLVTEMREIKHPFQQGIPAKKGIDF